MRKKILVTGAAGLIGRHIVPLLAETFDLILTDRSSGEIDGKPVHPLDITDYAAVAEATKGIDAILHLAIVSVRNFVTDIPKFDADEGEEYLVFNQVAIDVNMRGTYNIFEAARQNGVARVVFGSSLTILIGQPSYESFRDDLPRRPSNFYAVTKMFCEDLAEFFHRRHGVEAVALRLGTPFPQPWEPKSLNWLRIEPGRRTFISFRDLAGALTAGINAPWKRYAPCTVTSHAPGLLFDLQTAKEVIGWQPQDHFNEAGELIEGGAPQA